MTPIPQVKSKFRTFILLAGFGFLYVPILLLIVYSFNESRLVTVWSGFSVKWYGELFADNLMMNGVILSLTIGVLSASMAVVIGTLAAFVLTRIGNFRGQTSFAFFDHCTNGYARGDHGSGITTVVCCYVQYVWLASAAWGDDDLDRACDVYCRVCHGDRAFPFTGTGSLD